MEQQGNKVLDEISISASRVSSLLRFPQIPVNEDSNGYERSVLVCFVIVLVPFSPCQRIQPRLPALRKLRRRETERTRNSHLEKSAPCATAQQIGIYTCRHNDVIASILLPRTS